MDAVKQFVGVLQGLGDFDPGHYSRRLQKASKSTRCLSFFQYQGPDVSQNGVSFDNRDCLDLINLLAASSIARCLANASEDYGFRDAVDQGKAVELSKKTIASLLSSMYGDHVNNYLSSCGVRTLQELRNQAGFFENYHKLLLSPPFDHNALSQNVGRNYTLALLYCYEYFKHGPGFDMTEVLTAESEDMKHWVAVFKNWITQSQSDDFKKKNPDFRIEKLLVSVGGVLTLNGYPDATSRDVAQHLKDRVVGDIVKWEIADDVAQFQILGQNVWASWDSATYDYQSAVVQAVNDVKTEYFTIPTYSDVPPTTQVTKTYGEQVDQFMSEFWATSIFTKRAGNRIRTEYLNPYNFGGCFRPGTQVIISSGTKNIEDLREGDIVLTKGGESSQWGICSDEIVAQSAQSDGHQVPLYGFNGELPFTSANHVFYTTTGLRALDPAGARKENPWLEVGKLRVGHQLIWTKDGSTYEPITIQSITTEKADCSHIYGVHLREGLRSYHANGYLVHLNYPEITAKSISDAMRSIDPKTQIAMLAQFKELQPLFERFGGSTLADALTGQLKDSYTRKNPIKPMNSPENNQNLLPAVEHLQRQWNLQDDGDQDLASSGIRLPSVSTCEGVVALDGAYCHAASVKGRIIAWSREISGLGWEHGYFNLDQALMIGQGRVYYSVTFDSFDESQARHFIAYPTANTLPPDLVAGNMITDRKAKRLIGGDDSTSPMPLFKASTFSEAEVTATVGQPIFSTLEVELAEAQIGMMKMSVNTTSVTGAAVPNQWDLIDTYTLSYDTSNWNDKDASVKSPASLFEVTTAFHSESKVYSCRIPVLDRICDAAYAKAQEAQSFACVEEFYTCFRYKHPTTHNTVYEFRCNHPELIAQQADNWNKSSPSYQDLTFNGIGLPDVNLSFVFSVMSIELSADAQEVSGIIRRFDHKMSGEEGKRHRLIGAWSDTPVSAVRSILASNTVGTVAGAHISEMAIAHTSVAPQLFSLMAAASPPVPLDESIGAKELNDMQMPADLHDVAQKLIYQVMLYHMSDKDLESFVGVARPLVGEYEADRVPPVLGPNCEAGLKDWIQKKYIPAWLTQRISIIGDTSKEAFRKQLSNDQRKKLRYWWEGKGSGCMSKDDYYNRLNEMASQFALARLLPRLQAYKSDPNYGTTKPPPGSSKVETKSLNGGKRWAAALYNRFGVGPALSELASSIGSFKSSGFNPLQGIGNILQALDPIAIAVKGAGWTDANSPLCIRLTENVRRFVDKRGLTMPYVGISNDPFIEDEYQFLYDAMKELWINLIEGKPGYGDGATKKVKDDMEQIMKEIGVNQQWEAAKKAEMGLEVIQAMLKSGAVFAKANKDFAVGERIGEAWAGFRGRGAVGAVAVADYSTQAALDKVEDKMKASRIKAFAYSSMVVVSLGMYIGAAITAFKGWNHLEPADRAKLVLGAIQQAIYTLKSGGDAFKVILEFKADKQRFLAAAAAEAATTNDLRNAESQMRDLFGDEHLIDPEMRLNEKVASAGKSEFMEFEARELKIEMERYNEKANVENIYQEEKLRLIPRSHSRVLVVEEVIGAAIVVAMCFALYQNWGKLDWTDRILSIANIAVQAMSIVVEGIVLVAEIGFEVAGTIMTVCAWAGPILAIVGLVIMIVAMIIMAAQPPPLSSTEKWMDEVGYKFVNEQLSNPPSSKLSWDFSPTKFSPNNSSQKLSITGTNATNSDIKIDEVRTNITTGTSSSSLFHDDDFQEPEGTTAATGRFWLEASSDVLKNTLRFGHVAGAPSYGDQHSPDKDSDKQTPWSLSVRPIPTINSEGKAQAGKILLKPGEWLRLVIQGKTGPSYKHKFYLDVTEIWEEGDLVSSSTYIDRE